MAGTTLIRGEYVLTLERAAGTDTPDIVPYAGVVIEGSRIVDVGSWERLRETYPRADVIGDGRGLVVPGFVNTHGHFSEGLISGLAHGMALLEWLETIIRPVARELTPEMAQVATMLRGAEMALSGVTTVNDMFVSFPGQRRPITPGVVDGLEELGLRGQVSFGAQDQWQDIEPSDIFREHESLAQAAASSRRCSFRLGIANLRAQSEELLRRTIGAAHSEEWPLHTHFHEVREEVIASQASWGKSTIERAEEIGLLDGPVLAAHCVWMGPIDIQILAKHSVGIAHNPVSNMILASGVCPLGALRESHLSVGLGTDGPASNDSQDMLQVLKVGALLQKVHELDPMAATARDIVRMATIDGAASLGLDGIIGSLERGKAADIVLFRGSRPSLAVIHDPYEWVVYSAGPQDVSDVWVDGQRVVANGRLTTSDLYALQEEARQLAKHLVTRAGLERYVSTAQAEDPGP